MVFNRKFEAAVSGDIDNPEAIFLSLDDVHPGSSNCRTSDVAADPIDGTRVGDLQNIASIRSLREEWQGLPVHGFLQGK